MSPIYGQPQRAMMDAQASSPGICHDVAADLTESNISPTRDVHTRPAKAHRNVHLAILTLDRWIILAHLLSALSHSIAVTRVR